MCRSSFTKVKLMIHLSMRTHVRIFCFRESEELDTDLWLPSEAPHLSPQDHQGLLQSRTSGQVRSQWAQGSAWKLQARGKEDQCLQSGLASERPLCAQGLYLFSHQPKAFDPSLKSKNRKKGPFYSTRIGHTVWRTENFGMLWRPGPGPPRALEWQLMLELKREWSHFFLKAPHPAESLQEAHTHSGTSAHLGPKIP